MVNTAQDEIYRTFLEASQRQVAEMAAAEQSLADLILQAQQVRQEVAQQTAAAASTVRPSSGGGSAGKGGSSQDSGGGVLSEVLGVFKSGLGLSPLVKGIFSLFGGGDDKPAETPLVKYAMPPSIAFQAAELDGRVMSADYDQTGAARGYRTANVPARPSQTNGAGSGIETQQITVNVSAMDARSFLDRSGDIAAAVREAMLNLNSINDVVSEL
jgi:hypothetical protein